MIFTFTLFSLSHMPGELVAGGGVGGHTSLVIDGKSVSSLYKSTLGWDHLKTLAKTCDAVIACRLSPIQKSQLVRMVKSKSALCRNDK